MPNPPGNSPKDRRRPAPTIDLTATEVESRPVAWVEDEAKTDAPATGGNPPPPPPQGASRPGAAPPPWLPVAVGLAAGLLGALLVLLAAWLAGWPGGTATAGLDDRLARIEAQLGARPTAPAIDPAKVDDLASRLARAEAALARPATPDAALTNRLGAAEDLLKSFNQNIADLIRRGDEINATQRAIRERIDAHSATLAELARKAVTGAGIERAEVEALLGRIAALEAADRVLKEEIARNTDRAARLAVAAANLRAAVERGDGYAAELAAAKALGAPAQALAPLESFAASGLPSPAALARELSALTPDMTRLAGAVATTGEGVSFLDKLAANAEKLVRIRPADAPPGDEPRAIMLRAEQRAQTDPAAALAEIVKLEPQVRAPAAGWIKTVEARSAAVTAARRLADESARALTKASP